MMKNDNKTVLFTCYCGQAGNVKLNMLKCAKCNRWFHEKCVKCLDVPMLLGDRFYTFICSVCNAGSEYLGRLEMQWEEVVQLLLYNMTILENKKYFHLHDAIIPFLQDNWERFHLFGKVADEKGNLLIKVLQSLENFHSKFKCGKEVKKCKNNWALRVRAPPEAPAVFPSAPKLKKDVVIWDFQVQDRAYHLLFVKKSVKNKEAKAGKQKSKLPLTSSDHPKKVEVSKCHGSLPHNENGNHVAKFKNKNSTALFNEDSACSGLLDSLIPYPPDFNTINNPFQKSCKRSRLKPHSNFQNKILQTGTKKRKVTASSQNSNVFNSNEMPDGSANESTSPVYAKETFSKKSQNICIVGKRTSSTGKVQYLLHKSKKIQ